MFVNVNIDESKVSWIGTKGLQEFHFTPIQTFLVAAMFLRYGTLVHQTDNSFTYDMTLNQVLLALSAVKKGN